MVSRGVSSEADSCRATFGNPFSRRFALLCPQIVMHRLDVVSAHWVKMAENTEAWDFPVLGPVQGEQLPEM